MKEIKKKENSIDEHTKWDFDFSEIVIVSIKNALKERKCIHGVGVGVMKSTISGINGIYCVCLADLWHSIALDQCFIIAYDIAIFMLNNAQFPVFWKSWKS